jgi:hypothetical protein
MRKPALSKTNRVKQRPNKPIELDVELHPPISTVTENELEFPHDRCEMVRTPQEWHQEHFQFMEHTHGLCSNIEEAEELEAVVYFDHAHVRVVFCCTHCLEMVPWVGEMFGRTHVCTNCNANMTGEQACRAAYLALLGIRHPNCTLNEQDFKSKTDNLDPYAFVEQYVSFVELCINDRNTAERRALNLMKHLFGERVYNQIVNNGETWVKGADGMYYRLFWSRHGNVAVYEYRYKTQAAKAGKAWKPVAAYCGHFGENYPISDQIIAQICMLKTDPNRYINQANKVQDEHLSNCGPEVLHKAMMDKIMAIQI